MSDVNRPRICVIGHVEHVTLGRVESVPRPGEIAHMRDACIRAAGGGGLAFAQLVRSDAEVHFFTALGRGEAGDAVRARLADLRPGVVVHAAERDALHPRVVVMVDAAGRRTIIVTEEPLHAAATDPLDWSILARSDAVYFTGNDAEVLRRARAARRVVATARRRPVLADAAVAADVVIGSATDARENAPREAYAPPPEALVLTDGADPVRITRASGTTLVDAPPRVAHPRGDYGAGDSFAAALTYFVARGLSLEDAVRSAGPFGAAVLAGIDPLAEQRMLGAELLP